MTKKQCLAILSMLIAAPGHAQMTVTKGSSKVTSTGAFQYVVPLPVPVGRNGLTPNLSFIYDSNLGNGDFGLGWALGGMSMITRCPRTLAQDGYIDSVKFLSTDAYCLDGHRLIPVKGLNGDAGTEYRTEIDAIDSITSSGSYTFYNSNGGPTNFTVKTKSGLTIFYGSGVANQADVLTMGNSTPGKNNPIRGWAISEIRDRYYNQIIFYYTNQSLANQGQATPVDDGVFYPTSISYNQNPLLDPTGQARVYIWLNYNDRSEPPIRYAAGYALPHSDKQLQNVKISAVDDGGNLAQFGQYYIDTYDVLHRDGLPLRKNVLNVCGTDYCTHATQLEYESQLTQPFSFLNTAVGFPGLRADYNEYFVDLNGNGKKSWIRISQGADEAWIGTASDAGELPSDRWANVSQATISGSAYAHFFADIDGDGKADWIRISRSTSDAWYALGNGDGAFKPWIKVNAVVGPANSTKHYFVDVNGDGRADWVQIGPLGANQSWTSSVALATGNGNFQFWSSSSSTTSGYTSYIDLNGDGVIDNVLMNSSNPVDLFGSYIGKGDGTFTAVWSSMDLKSSPDYRSYMGSRIDTQFADINGDGNADLIQIYTTSIFVAYGKGDGSFAVPRYVGDAKTGGLNLFADIDGDGMTDRISTLAGAPTGSTIQIYASTGSSNPNSYLHPVDFSLSPANATAGNNQLYLADLNGDGKADLIMVSAVTGKAWIAVSQAVFSGKMTSIGLQGGPKTEIKYKPISDSAVYTPDTDAVYPLRDAVFPRKYSAKMPTLVSSVVSPNGIGGTLTTAYRYAGAKTDLRYRGFLGMRARSATQVETGVTTTDTYRLDFPYTGLPVSSKTTIASGGNGGLLSQADFTYGCTNFVNGGCAVAPGSRYFPYISVVKTSKWDLNGSALPVVTTSYVYDDFGNVTRLTKSTSDGFVEQTDTVYSNDTVNWWIGRPTKVTQTKTAP
jgi:hypothetical protein